MNTLKLKLFVGVFAVALLLPSTSMAYFTTAQSATKLTNDTILYTVTYKFGFENRELYMPIMAIRENSMFTPNKASTIPHTKFVIQNKDGSISTAGVASSIVITNDKNIQIRDSQYYLPAGKVANFQLIALLTIPKENQTDDMDLSLLVTSLPFKMIQDGTPIPAQLNPSELQYYHTPAINLLKQKLTISGAVHTLTAK